MLHHKHRHRLRRFLLFFLLCFLGCLGTVQAEETTQEYKLKAAFLVNFSRFITWPEQSFSGQQDFILCVAGKNPFGTTLHAVEGQKFNGRNLRIVFADSIEKLPQCHMLYISRAEKSDLDALLSRIVQQPVVTVSDIPGFVTSGGSIEFVTRENRLSFVINHSVLKKHGIQASASMLDLAASVQ